MAKPQSVGYAGALSAPRPKAPSLHSIEMTKAENGGVILHHRMEPYGGKEPGFAFGKDEGHELAAHITKHMGIPINVQNGNQDEEEVEHEE